MILGRDVHLHAACFDEIDASVQATLTAANDPRVVVFNAHAFPQQVPAGAIIYNLENVDVQISGDAFKDHEIWDFSARNAARWRGARRPVHHVPPGYHACMKRFVPLPWGDRDIDVLFAGCMNPRRQQVIDELARCGLKTRMLSAIYGPARDEILARSKIAVGMLFYPEGTFTALRSAHCVANGLAIVSEVANEAPAWAYPTPVPHGDLVERCRQLLAGGEEAVTAVAAEALRRFQQVPLRLPAREMG